MSTSPYESARNFLWQVQGALKAGEVENGFLWTNDFYPTVLTWPAEAAPDWQPPLEVARALGKRFPQKRGTFDQLSSFPYGAVISWNQFRNRVGRTLYDLLPRGRQAHEDLMTTLGADPAIDSLPEEFGKARVVASQWADGLSWLIARDMRRGETGKEAAQGALESGMPGTEGDSAENIFRKDGDYWTLRFQGGRVMHLRHRKGLSYIAILLSHPVLPGHRRGHFSALKLVAQVEGLHAQLTANDEYSKKSRTELDEEGMSSILALIRNRGNPKDSEEWLAAKEAKYESADDPAEKAELKEQIEEIKSEVDKMRGFQGRPRNEDSPLERARINVTKQIKSAIDQIAKQDKAFGRHLRAFIETGASCCYSPVEEIHWVDV